MYHYHCTPFFTSNTLSHQEIRFIFRVPIRTCWSLNIFNNILGLVQYFLSSHYFMSPFPINLNVWQVLNLLSDKIFLRYSENAMQRIPICFAWKDINLMQKFLNGKKLNFLLPTTSATYNFPKTSLPSSSPWLH